MFPQEPTVPQIPVDEVKKMIDTNEDLVLLDVRTEGECARGKILNSINIPVDQVQEDIESLNLDKNKKIVVYCLSGSRSVFAVEMLLKMGYSKTMTSPRAEARGIT